MTVPIVWVDIRQARPGHFEMVIVGFSPKGDRMKAIIKGDRNGASLIARRLADFARQEQSQSNVLAGLFGIAP